MKIYTRKGDQGFTSLLGGTQASKADLVIEAYGTVDELNAWVGLLRDQLTDEATRTLLREIQDRLFTIGSTLAAIASPNASIPDLHAEDVTRLEEAMDAMDAQLPELRAFILPGGHPLVSHCHLARTVCRRAERRVVALKMHHTVADLIITYLNRLSDYFFVLGRKVAQELQAEEVAWRPRK
ncbi:cob(I)alamin adenosyltransferase [Catalinimonas alkaloidigena]|uniref:Corrinoid adenosyltransferase n=1 Tax=Catalinimonas alkaloidigena TaxID=1075417 RepID=A0A1G9SX78_9BACT|nr:cob(I)yrinic acid a,c-diamide adenosyltransferase [Catalinimonas alkaloidigena]SDM40014.1 cob(I)alamin adenosyltransferase [Catalinimonas alkaloidigena]